MCMSVCPPLASSIQETRACRHAATHAACHIHTLTLLINQPFHDNAQGINYLQASFVRAIQQPLGIINPLMTTLKPQSNGPSYSNIVIGTLAVDGWAVTFGAARRSWTGPQPAQTTARCTKCNSPPINGQCTNFVLFDVAL